MSNLLFYRQQEARERSAAEQTTLDNVRDRCERAAEAWAILADRIERTDAARQQTAAEKAALA